MPSCWESRRLSIGIALRSVSTQGPLRVSSRWSLAVWSLEGQSQGYTAAGTIPEALSSIYCWHSKHRWLFEQGWWRWWSRLPRSRMRLACFTINNECSGPLLSVTSTYKNSIHQLSLVQKDHQRHSLTARNASTRVPSSAKISVERSQSCMRIPTPRSTLHWDGNWLHGFASVGVLSVTSCNLCIFRTTIIIEEFSDCAWSISMYQSHRLSRIVSTRPWFRASDEVTD